METTKGKTGYIVEKKIGAVTYVITVEQEPGATSSLREKLMKLIMDAARKDREELSQ